MVAGAGLDAATIDRWRELQHCNPTLASPCFSPEFAQAVSVARSDAEVGVVRKRAEIVALFPYQRSGGGHAIPLGGIVSDYQGVVCEPEFECDARELLEGCRLIAWDFDRLLASQTFFAPFHKLCEPSALIDVRGGYKAYAQKLLVNGSKQLVRCRNLMRRLERKVGPLRFVCHSSDRRALTKILRWKSHQYKRSGWRDLFATKWGRVLIERIHSTQTDDFAGMLSLLFAGDRLVAGHIEMRSRSVWHYWFPAYNTDFARFSPGIILLLKMIEHAPGLGLQTIDLGTGQSLYKQRLSNASIQVAEGSVERPSWLWLAREARRRLRPLAFWRHR